MKLKYRRTVSRKYYLVKLNSNRLADILSLKKHQIRSPRKIIVREIETSSLPTLTKILFHWRKLVQLETTRTSFIPHPSSLALHPRMDGAVFHPFFPENSFVFVRDGGGGKQKPTSLTGRNQGQFRAHLHAILLNFYRDEITPKGEFFHLVSPRKPVDKRGDRKGRAWNGISSRGLVTGRIREDTSSLFSRSMRPEYRKRRYRENFSFPQTEERNQFADSA